MITKTRKHQLGGDPPKPRKKMQHRESDHQMRFVEWLRARPNWKVTRIENEGRRTPAQTRRAKAMGMTPGDPDLLLVYKSHVIWLEMKDGKGSLSDNQQAVHVELRHRCQDVFTAYSLDQAIDFAIRRESYYGE